MMVKACSVCCSEVVLRVNPSESLRFDHSSQQWELHNNHGHTARACHACWEAFLSMEIEEKTPHGLSIECALCNDSLIEDDWQKLARKDTVQRYNQLKLQQSWFRCQNRCEGPPPADQPTKYHQPHDREAPNGRVFTCKNCSFQTCVDCDAPEHVDETCEVYQSRIKAAHAAEEVATATAYKQCPECKTCFEMEKGCGYVQCKSCMYRFCSRCLIPWVGADSAYLGGRDQHGVKCTYRTRATPSTHAIKHRFVEDDEDLARKKARLTEKAELKKAALKDVSAGITVKLQDMDE